MRTMRKQFRHLIIAICLMFLVIGFAAFSATLKINGTYNISAMKWDVHFENVNVTTGSVNASVSPTTNNVDTTEMTYTIDFTKPGDFYEFTVDVVNKGSMDAMVDNITNNVYASNGVTQISLPTYLNSSISYDDGGLIETHHLLEKNQSVKLKVKVEFKKDVFASELPSNGDTTIKFKLVANYTQADENAVFIKPLEEKTWDEIVDNIENNKAKYYKLGDTKKVTLNMDFDEDGVAEDKEFTIRVANNSTPKECKSEEFSKTGCGFVLEFEDIIIKKRMNPYTSSASNNGNGSKGGWKYSEMRTYLNNDIYNALPSELRNKIIDTDVISSAELNVEENYETTDKLYLLSTMEIYGKIGTTNVIQFDTAEDVTRQLDYYYENDVTTSNYGNIIKKYNNYEDNWWTRSARSNSSSGFYGVSYAGNWYDSTSSYEIGVSPAFRIG